VRKMYLSSKRWPEGRLSWVSVSALLTPRRLNEPSISLAEGAQDVLKLEAMARGEALLGERQRITDAKPFKRAKYSLRIRSVRAGFGPNGSWRWELPCDRDGASTASPVASQPVRAERCIPVDWVEGVEIVLKSL